MWEWMGNGDAVIKCSGERYWRDGTKLRPMESTLHYVSQNMYPMDIHESSSGVCRVRDHGVACRSMCRINDVYARLGGV